MEFLENTSSSTKEKILIVVKKVKSIFKCVQNKNILTCSCEMNSQRQFYFILSWCSSWLRSPDTTLRKQRVDATRLNGLGVWFSLWVREVPGSNPGWAQFYFFYGETDIVSHDIYSNICSILTANLIFCQSYNKNFLKKFWATKLQLSANKTVSRRII